MNEQNKFFVENQNELCKPWLNADERLHCDAELKSLSADWNAETWEAFLSSTVDRELSRHECVVDDYPLVLEEKTETIWEIQNRVPEPIQRCIDSAIRKLSEPQRIVIRGIYFHEIPQVKIARMLKVTASAVNQAKNLSLKNIRDLIGSDLNVIAYLIGGSANTPLKAQTKEQELLTVYRADLKGSYMK